MAKNQNSAEKRRREVEKKFKADEKRKNRQKRKIEGPVAAAPTDYNDDIPSELQEPPQ
jgi:hypothetical protein